MRLTDLPSDLLVIVLSHLDFPSLSQIVQTHSSFNSAWKEYPEQLCRAICIRTGLADSKTVGAAAPLVAEGQLKREGLEDEPSEEELRDVIKEQRVMDGSFEGVNSWTQYARTSWRIDRNWTYGRHKEEVMEIDFTAVREHGFEGASSFWRFKLDPVSGWIVVTGLLDGIWAFEMDGKLVWYSTFPRGAYNHSELTYDNDSNMSFFCTRPTMSGLLVWRFHDNPDEPPPTTLPDVARASLSTTYRSLDSRGRGWHPYVLFPTQDFRACKFRFPCLVVSTSNPPMLKEWNVTEPERRIPWYWSLERVMEDQGRAEEELSDGEGEVTYVDFDNMTYFVSGNRSVQVLVIGFPDGYSHGIPGQPRTEWATWPPNSPDGYRYLQPLIPRPLYRENGVNLRPWSAVHHDSRFQYLVGASTCDGPDSESSFAILSITYRYRPAFRAYLDDNREELEQRTMNLRLDGVMEISQLSVENDRAVFIVKSELGHALFVVPLRPFNSLTKFVSNPPKPICLSYPLPCLSSPSRIESTSTEIFVPILVGLANSSTPLDLAHERFIKIKSQWAELGLNSPFPMKWQTLDGQTLVDYEKECLDQEGWRKFEGAWFEIAVEGGDADWNTAPEAANGFMRFSFDVNP